MKNFDVTNLVRGNLHPDPSGCPLRPIRLAPPASAESRTPWGGRGAKLETLRGGDGEAARSRSTRIAERESLTVPVAALMISWALEREFCLPPRRSSSPIARPKMPGVFLGTHLSLSKKRSLLRFQIISSKQIYRLQAIVEQNRFVERFW